MRGRQMNSDGLLCRVRLEYAIGSIGWMIEMVKLILYMLYEVD